ncbi:hypothetical protein WN943_026215 [Citrus x changshan-huyou]
MVEPEIAFADLKSEHERCLTEVNQKPLIVYNYPQGIKAFYMRLTDDLETLAAADVHLVAKAWTTLEMLFPFQDIMGEQILNP